MPNCVPRETISGQTPALGLRFNAPMIQSIERGWKTETRRPFSNGNCQLDRGEFKALDLASGRPDGLSPVSSLKCRVVTKGGDRRSVTVSPRIRPGQLLWPRRGQSGPAAKRVNARLAMRVTHVACVRLNDLSDAEAYAEGIRIFSETACKMESAADIWRPVFVSQAYVFLLEQLGPKRQAQWCAGPIHQDIVGRPPSARDAFALLWESVNGTGSWRANPWVWRYVFVAESVPVFGPVNAPEAPLDG